MKGTMALPANIKIVFEDDYIMVVNKPPGLLVVPTPKNERYTLTSLLKAYLCHRLDRETSGLIVYAKKKYVRDKMVEAFRKREVKKRYIGFAQGFLKKPKGVINKRIEGKSALTYYRVLEQRKKGFSIVEIEPVTGRTNQIRIHFKILGHPLVGERKFAFGKDFPLKFRRCALHARYIEFNHPATGKRISFYADLPGDMKKFLSS
jgi:RluA family pseudouridine synthase